MTDARLKGSWLGAMRFDGLSDCAWRVFTGALMWSVEQGTDGLIPTRYLRTLHPDGEQPEAYAELLAARLWISCATGYQLLDWAGDLGQSTAQEIEAYKENARNRQRTWRENQRKKLEDKNTRAVPQLPTKDPAMRDVTRDVTRDVGNGEGEGEGTDSEAATSETFWPVVDIPQSWVDPETGVVEELI
jgi:hypothetical protein